MKSPQLNDPLLRVQVIAATPSPQHLVRLAMAQCYSAGPVILPEISHTQLNPTPAQEVLAGHTVVDRLLAGGRGHYGPLEHSHLTVGIENYPHSAIVQITRHRHLTFDVQSGRYTSKGILSAAQTLINWGVAPGFQLSDRNADLSVRAAIESVVYRRPIGRYQTRKGRWYDYDQTARDRDLSLASDCILNYHYAIESGQSEEHARGLLPYDVRQSCVMTGNIRALMHLLDLRHKPDAQLEIQYLSHQLFQDCVQPWIPEIADWYQKSRLGRSMLAP